MSYISSNSIKFSAFSFYMYSPTLNIWFLNLVFLWFMYSLCRSSHRCINHLILDSGDSSEVPGTLANDVFKFVLKSNYLPSLKTRLSNVYFSFYFSTYHPFHIFSKQCSTFGSNILFLKKCWGTGRALRQRTLCLSIF